MNIDYFLGQSKELAVRADPDSPGGAAATLVTRTARATPKQMPMPEMVTIPAALPQVTVPASTPGVNKPTEQATADYYAQMPSAKQIQQEAAAGTIKITTPEVAQVVADIAQEPVPYYPGGSSTPAIVEPAAAVAAKAADFSLPVLLGVAIYTIFNL
jgi:hypothetical protein